MTHPKYLLFSMTSRKTGVDNVFRILNLVFKEARYLGRIPVIGKFTMSPSHNLSKLRSDLCFDDYLDLSNGITLQFEDGFHKPIASNLEWIREEDLDLTNHAPNSMYAIDADKIITEEMNQQYDVIIRRDPTFKYTLACKEYKYGSIQIDFPYSEKVNKLTDAVLDALGISREDAMAAQRYLLSEFRGVESCADIFLNNGYYACMHVRASIDDRDYGQPIFPFAASKIQIKSVLKQALRKGSRVYIMSDIHRAKFFDFLKSDYQIYRYYDFPQLRNLVSGEDGRKIDNIMLYLVEKNIMKYALIKILPPHKGPMIYHLNTVYDMFSLKEPPQIKERLVQ